jgi:hypothetical protein
MDSPNTDKKPKPTTQMCLGGLALACVPLFAAPLGSGDYFWHLKTGDLILEQGSLPGSDIFQALSPERAWCTFQWLYEVVLALTEPLVGLRGIRWMHAIVAGLGLWLWSFHLGRFLKLRTMGTLLLAAVLLFLYTDRIRIRPHLFNLLLIGALLPVLLEPRHLRGRLGKTLAIFLLALLANLHAGGGLIALCLLVASTAGVLFSTPSSPGQRREAGLFLGAAILISSLMPGFFQGAIQALQMENTTRTLFLEWQPPTVYLALPAPNTLTIIHHNTLGLFPYLCSAILATLLVRRIYRGGLTALLEDHRLPAIALALAASILAMRSARFVHYGLLMLPGMHALAADLFIAWRLPALLRRTACAALLAALIVSSFQYRMAALGPSSNSFARWFSLDIIPGVFPEKAAEYMLKNKLRGGVYNISAHHGSYLIGKLYPQIRVHYDGRGNLSTGEANTIAFLTWERWKPEARAQVIDIYNKSGLEFVLTPPPAFSEGPTPPGFRLLYKDRIAELWQRGL